MTDLTEQWKKGELPEGWYWIKGSRAEGIYAYTAEYLNHMYSPKNSDRIIEPVPSFEQWQEYKNENDSMFDTIKMLNKDNGELEKENAKLKELLKKHRDIFARTLALCIDLNFGEKQKNQFADDIAEIDQALGEDK